MLSKSDEDGIFWSNTFWVFIQELIWLTKQSTTQKLKLNLKFTQTIGYVLENVAVCVLTPLPKAVALLGMNADKHFRALKSI